MARYSTERREAVVGKMKPPHNMSIPALAEETGISMATLYNWRDKAREKGVVVPADGKNPEQWSSEAKFTVVLETAPLNAAQLAEYCRQKGLYVEQVGAWRDACAKANATSAERARAEREQHKAEHKRIRHLERELTRKEKALAETAALLVLRKKADAIWGEPEGD